MERKRRIRYIKVDVDKCNGCRMCESICAAYHSDPVFSIANQKRSRIRVVWREDDDVYIPIRAGKPTDVECIGRMKTTVRGKDYDECSFCRHICPSRDLFFQPGPGLPLECDMCGEPGPEGGPLCVQWCHSDALLYEEKEVVEEIEETEEDSEVEVL